MVISLSFVLLLPNQGLAYWLREIHLVLKPTKRKDPLRIVPLAQCDVPVLELHPQELVTTVRLHLEVLLQIVNQDADLLLILCHHYSVVHVDTQNQFSPTKTQGSFFDCTSPNLAITSTNYMFQHLDDCFNP